MKSSAATCIHPNTGFRKRSNTGLLAFRTPSPENTLQGELINKYQVRGSKLLLTRRVGWVEHRRYRQSHRSGGLRIVMATTQTALGRSTNRLVAAFATSGWDRLL